MKPTEKDSCPCYWGAKAAGENDRKTHFAGCAYERDLASLRDRFATAALAAQVANAEFMKAALVAANENDQDICDRVAEMAYEVADAMMKARTK